MLTATGTWPDSKAYHPAVTRPSQFIRDQRLHRLAVEPHPNFGGKAPFGRTGRFGSVFKFTGSGETFALKVFIREAPDRQLRYDLIHKHLNRAEPISPRLMSFKYDPEGILVRGEWRPTLIMEWSSGLTLDQYLAEWLKSRPSDNARWCKEWVETIQYLRSCKVAHGDLQHENVIVKDDGTFQLIDYDGMFVPEMRDHHLGAAEVGRPAYQHPARNAQLHSTDYFDERLDDFGALVILLSLAAVDADMWSKYHDDDRLIISEQDLRAPAESLLLTALADRLGPVATLTRLLMRAAEGGIEAVPSFETVIADPDVRVLLDGSAYRPTPAPRRPSGSVPPGLLPRFLTEPASQTRPVTVPKSPVGSSPVGHARQKAVPAPTGTATPAPTGTATPALTSREVDVARLLAKGLSAPEIASQLKLTPDTVNRYLSRLRKKTGSGSLEVLNAWARAQYPQTPKRRTGKKKSSQPSKSRSQRETAPPGRALNVPRARPVTEISSEEAPPALPSQPESAPKQPDLIDIFGNLPTWQTPASGKPTVGQPPGASRAAGSWLLGRHGPIRLSGPSAEVMRLTTEGEAHLQANRNKQALQAFNQALAQQPNYAQALVGRGEAYRRMQRFEEAIRDLNLATELRPNDARALQVRGETNRDAGRKFRALTDRLRAKWRRA